MALNTAALNTAADAFATAYPYLSIHTDTTVSSSANESSAARVAANWSTASGGAVSATNAAFTGGAASGAAKRVGYWSAATDGDFGGSSLLTGDQAFNADGEYTVTSVTETASAS